jgi:hypothetical protein
MNKEFVTGTLGIEIESVVHRGIFFASYSLIK